MKYLGFSLITLLLMTLAAPVRADVGINDLLVRRKDGAVNIRVNLRNFGQVGAKGPFHLEIFGRADANESWQSLKVWTNIGKLAPGYKVSRDFFGPNSALLQQLSTLPTFEIQAILSGSGKTPVSMTSSVQDES